MQVLTSITSGAFGALCYQKLIVIAWIVRGADDLFVAQLRRYFEFNSIGRTITILLVAASISLGVLISKKLYPSGFRQIAEGCAIGAALGMTLIALFAVYTLQFPLKAFTIGIWSGFLPILFSGIMAAFIDRMVHLLVRNLS
jgi:hypothetical protein